VVDRDDELRNQLKSWLIEEEAAQYREHPKENIDRGTTTPPI